MLWCCIDMRLAGSAGAPPYVKRVRPAATQCRYCVRVWPLPRWREIPGRTQKSPGGEFRVSPRYLLCGVSLPGGGTTGVEVDGVREVIPLAANSVDFQGGWLVHTFLLSAKVRLGRRGGAPAEPRGCRNPNALIARDG